MKHRIFCVISCLLTILTPAFLHAETTPSPYSIALIVNKDVISRLDVEQRLTMAIATAGLERSKAVESSMLPQIIQQLIDEKLYLSEAKKLGLTVSESEKEAAIRTIEANNNLDVHGFDTFLKERNLDKRIFLKQLEAQIAWNKVVTKKLRPFVTITEAEINEELEYTKPTSGTQEVFISEISLVAETPADRKELEVFSTKLVEELRRGGNFKAIARQFSRSTSAEQGGEIGWIEEQQLSPLLRKSLQALEPGDISDVITTNDGFAILKLHDRRVHKNKQKTTPPNREAIHDKLLQQKLLLNARKYLRDIRRQAFIEIRM